MDLIKALEELNLEVKNKESNNVRLKSAIEHETTATNTYSDNQSSHKDDICRLQQMLDFNSSLNTLIVQINELDCTQQTPSGTGATKRICSEKARYSMEALTRLHRLSRNQQETSNWWPRENIAGGSLETSQEEEDSDCSLSHQTEPSKAEMNPLVRDLLAKDLSSITETVRKIGRILALGKAIKNMYHTLADSEMHLISALSSHPDAHYFLQDLTYGISMCNLFQGLCSDNRHIMNLPTILYYNDYCLKLQTHIKLLSDSAGKLKSTTETISDINHHHSDNLRARKSSSPMDHMEEDAVTSEAVDDCLQNWKENKLYVEHNKYQQI